jgi:large subunit ribosomal protein L23
MSKTIVLRPRLSEKTYSLSESRVYVVDVPKGLNKHEVKKAIEAQFEVKVTKVNVTNIPGKAKRTISLSGKRMTNSEGKRTDIRKAYITLAEGNSLPFFAAVEEEEKKEEALQEKFEKAATKQAQKEEKKGRGSILRRRTGSRGDK